MKTFVIIVSEYFPSYHKKKGKETQFEKSILLTGNKIHTIRQNYKLWKERFEMVNKGEACISLRKWSGKPYRSKQIEIKRLFNSDGIGIEKLQLSSSFKGSLVNGSIQHPILEKYLSLNDGLLPEDFQNWFSNYDFKKPLAIIHFTKFRYENLFTF